VPAAPAVASNALAPVARTPGAPSFDWVPRAELAPEIARALPEYCDGTYVEPPYPLPLGVDPATLPIETHAQNLEYWLKDRALLTGDIDVTRGNQSMRASQATYNETTQTINVESGLTLREPGMLVNGQRAEVALQTGAASVSDAQFVLQNNELRGTAAMLERDAVGNLRIVDGSFTRCEPGNNNWHLTSSDVRIGEGAKFGTARNAVLRVHDVPVLYTPYIRFPVTNERMSGWLFPDLGYSSQNGADIAMPYYLNLAPNYDLTLTPRYISDRGAGLQADFRDLTEHSRSELGGAFLYHDHDYDGELSRSQFNSMGEPGSFDPADRWLIRASHDGAFDDIQTLVDYTKVSDLDYFRDLGTNLASASQVDLEQFGAVQYQHRDLFMRLWAQDFQPLDNDGLHPYQRLPGFDLNYRGRLLGPLNWSLATAWSDFDRPNGTLTGIEKINGKRLHIEPRLQLPFDGTFGFVHAEAGYRYTRYDLQDQPAGDNNEPERKIWLGSLDSGLYFERDGTLFGTGTQTLEPRLFYLYQQYDNQNELPQFDVAQLDFTFDQLFRDNTFAGLDRIADANQLTAALTTRLLDAQTGHERLRMSLGETLYFDDRQVTLSGTPTSGDRHSRSPLAGQVAASLGGDFTLLTDATFDPNNTTWDEVGVALQYRPDNRHIVNLGYRRRDDLAPLLRQSDMSVYWSVFRHWSLIGRFNYDYKADRTIDAMAGLEYSDCCWQIRFVGRRFLTQPGNVQTADAKADKGIYLQIVFKGLAGLGGRIDSLMRNGIPGYRAEEF